MRAALTVLTDELKRLRTSGVKSVAVSEESLALLRKVVAARSGTAATLPSRPSEVASVSINVAGAAPSSPQARPPVSAPPIVRTAASPKVEPVVNLLPKPPAITLPPGSKQERWDALRVRMEADEFLRERVRPGKKWVMGVGSLDAKIFFCGDAPGAEEEEQGEPFVGPAGQLLTKMVQGMGLKRSDVYLGSLMNWRLETSPETAGAPAVSRQPTMEEMTYCLPYLRAQLEIVAPQVIVVLGAVAAQGVLGAGAFKTLGDVRGQWREFAGRPVMVTYHPSYILRNPTNRSKRAIWEDFLKVMERSELPISDKQRGFFLDK